MYVTWVRVQVLYPNDADAEGIRVVIKHLKIVLFHFILLALHFLTIGELGFLHIRSEFPLFLPI